jgi:hypothetical protein
MINFILTFLMFISPHCLAHHKTSTTTSIPEDLNNFFSNLLKKEDKSMLRVCLNEKHYKKEDRKLFAYLKNKVDPSSRLTCKEISDYYTNSKYLTLSNISLDNLKLLISMPQIKFLTLRNTIVKDPSVLLKLPKLRILTLKKTNIEEHFLNKLTQNSQQNISIYVTK